MLTCDHRTDSNLAENSSDFNTFLDNHTSVRKFAKTCILKIIAATENIVYAMQADNFDV